MAVEASPTGQIQEFLRVLRRRRWQIALPALFVLTLGSAFAVIVPKKYVVKTRVEIKDSRNEFDYELKNRGQSGIAREKSNIAQHIIHYARIDSIVSTRLIADFPEYEYGDSGKRHDIVEAVMKNLEVEQVEGGSSGSTFYDITYKDVDRDRAEDFLAELNRAWIDEVIQREREELSEEGQTLRDAFVDADQTYRERNDRWVEQCDKVGHNPSLPPYEVRGRPGEAQGDFVFVQLAALKGDRERNQADLLVKQTALETVRRQYEEEGETEMVPERAEGTSYAEEIRTLERKLAGREAFLATLRPQNKEYRKVQDEIAQLGEQIEEFRARQTEAADVWVERPNETRKMLLDRVREAEKEVKSLEAEREHIAARIAEFEKERVMRTQEFGLLSELWDERVAALEGRETARKELAQKEIAIRNYDQSSLNQYDIAQPPNASDTAREPSVLLLVAFALFAGLALGLGVALLAEYGRNSYRTANELATVMAVPVLGAVGEILTRREKLRMRRQRTVVGVSSAVVLLGISWVTFLYADEGRQALLPVTVLRAIDDFRLMLM